jgi:galactokinase
MSPGPTTSGTGTGTAPHWYPEPDEATGVDAAVAAFRTRFRREPDGVWASPGRVNLIGEHVDYNGGLCLPFALPHKTFVALAGRDDDLVSVASQQTGQRWQGRLSEVTPGIDAGWAGYVVGVPWALRRRLGPAAQRVSGFDAAVAGFVPVGSGLSSSAALEGAVALALDDVAGLGLGGDDAGRAALAAACVDAENLIAGAPTGGMDQAASLRGRTDHAMVLDCRDFSLGQVPFSASAAGLEVLVIDTRAHHALVDGRYGSRRAVCEQAARLLGVRQLVDVDPTHLAEALHRLGYEPAADELVRRVRHVVTEIARVKTAVDLLRAGRMVELGPLLDASHASLREDYEVSCAELDVACESARSAGALGARMTGGGFGGSVIALVASDRVPDVASAVAAAFADRGFTPAAFLRAVPSGAGHRVA